MMTGKTTSILSIIRFISIYVIGIAIVLFLIIMIFNYSKLIIKNQFQDFSKNINTEMFSGFMIILVGIVYFSYNLFGEVH